MAGVDQHFAEGAPADAPAQQRQHIGEESADGAGLGGVEKAAVDAAEHDEDQDHDRHDLDQHLGQRHQFVDLSIGVAKAPLPMKRGATTVMVMMAAT